jgi:hypothetical protein
VLHALRRGFREVRLGQTSSFAKCSIGARPRRLEAFIHLRSRPRHRVLERFGPRLFPEVAVPSLRVFRGGN